MLMLRNIASFTTSIVRVRDDKFKNWWLVGFLLNFIQSILFCRLEDGILGDGRQRWSDYADRWCLELASWWFINQMARTIIKCLWTPYRDASSPLRFAIYWRPIHTFYWECNSGGMSNCNKVCEQGSQAFCSKPFICPRTTVGGKFRLLLWVVWHCKWSFLHALTLIQVTQSLPYALVGKNAKDTGKLTWLSYTNNLTPSVTDFLIYFFRERMATWRSEYLCSSSATFGISCIVRPHL